MVGILIFNLYNQKNQNLPHYATAEGLKEIQEINNTIDKVELTKKIVNELTKNGFSPDKRIQYTIYSADEKTLTLSLPSSDIDDEKILKITNIVNTISNQNGLNTFSIEIMEIGRSI